MKKLELAETPKNEKKLFGAILIEKAKEDLKNFIVKEISLLYTKLGYEMPNWEEEDMILEEEDWRGDVFINVRVDNTYLLDGEYDATERRKVEMIDVECDGGFFVTFGEDGEAFWNELSVEELENIANTLERTYLN